MLYLAMPKVGSFITMQNLNTGSAVDYGFRRISVTLSLKIKDFDNHSCTKVAVYVRLPGFDLC
jgi:hypothetical protein